MLEWMESRWQDGIKIQDGGGHPGQQYGEQACCSCEMSDSNHSISDKAARACENKREYQWDVGRTDGDAWLLNPIFIFLSVNHPIQYWMEATHDRGIGEDWILLNWSLPIRHLKADNSPILYLEADEAAVKKLLCVRNTLVFVSSVVSRLVRQLCAACAGPGLTHNRDQL